MNEEQEKSPRPSRPLFLRLLKGFGICIGSLLLLLCGILAAGLFWLRTETGENHLREFVLSSLQETGITASFSSFEGPLPGTLHVTGLTLADTQGVWFTLQEGTIRLYLPDLLRGQLTIGELSLIAPDLTRIPESEAPAVPDPADSPLDMLQKDTLKSLGENIHTILKHATLGKIRIDNLKLGADLAGSPLVLNLAGGGPLTDLHTHFRLETPLLASIFPGYADGFAPFQKAEAKTPAEQTESSRIPALTGTLILGNEGNWLSSLTESGRFPDVAVLLEADLSDPLSEMEPDAAEDGRNIPIVLRQAPENKTASLRLLASLQNAELAIETLNLTLPGGEISGNRLTLQEKSLEGSFTAKSADPALLYSLFAPPSTSDLKTESQSSVLPFGGAALQGTLSGTPEAPLLHLQVHFTDIVASTTTRDSETVPPSSLDLLVDLNLAAQAIFEAPSLKATGEIRLDKGSMPVVQDFETARRNTPAADNRVGTATISDTEQAGLPDNPEQLTIRLETVELAGTENGMELQSLHLTSEIFEVQGNARMTDTGQIRSEASLSSPSLHLLLARMKPFIPVSLSDQDPLNGLDGIFALTLRAERNTEGDPLKGDLDLSLKSMRWGIRQAQAMLGETVSLSLGFAVRPQSDGPEINIRNLVLTSAEARGNASLDLTPDGHLKADILLKLASLAGLEAGLSGKADIRANVSGPLNGPAIKLQAASPGLDTGSATLKGLQILLDATTLGTNGGKGHLLLTGQVEGDTLASRQKTGALRLSCDWDFAPTFLTLEKMALELPGTKLGGSLRTTLAAQPALSGTLSLDIRDWTALSALTGIPLRGDPARMRVRATHTGTQHIEMNWNSGTLAGENFSLRSLKGDASVEDPFGKMKLAVKAELGPGTLSGTGLGWRNGQIRLSGEYRKLDVDARLSGRTTLDLKAGLDLANSVLDLSRLHFLHKKNRTSSAGIDLQHPVRIDFRHGISAEKLSLAVIPAGKIIIDGHLGTGTQSLEASMEGLSLKLLESFSAWSTPEGILNGNLSLKGTSSRPRGTMELSLTNLGYPDTELPPVALRLTGTLNDAGLDMQAIMNGLGETPATGNLQLPLRSTAEGIPQPAMDRQMTGSLQWTGELAQLWQFVPLANTALRGKGSMNAAISGTLAAPQITASLKLVGASFEDILAGLLITDINTDVELRSHGISTFTFSAGDGGKGTVTLGGTVGTFAEGLPLNLTGTIRNLAPLHRNDLEIDLSGDLSIEGSAATPDVHADLTINKGQFRILESFGTSIPTLDVVDNGQPRKTAAPENSGPNLDVTVTIPNQFFVRGAGLDSEWRGKLHVAGTATNPMITGMLASVRGTFALLGKQFALSKGEVSFSGSTPPNPLLDIQFSYEAPNITALASIGGTASSPVLSFSSQPALPQDEVVAQILFGQSTGSLGRMEAIQLAAELASLAGFGRGKGGVMGELRESLGFDVLRFGSMQEGGQRRRTTGRAGLLQPNQNGTTEESESIPALEVGKYITDDIYVGLEQGMNGDATGVRIEIELTPSLNLQGSTTPQGSEVGVNWKKDY